MKYLLVSVALLALTGCGQENQRADHSDRDPSDFVPISEILGDEAADTDSPDDVEDQLADSDEPPADVLAEADESTGSTAEEQGRIGLNRNGRERVSSDLADSAAGDDPGHIVAELVDRRDTPTLRYQVADRELIAPEGSLHTSTDCTVTIKSERIPEGVLLHFTITNEHGSPRELPDLTIQGIRLARSDIEILENWKHIHFKRPMSSRDHQQLHAMRSYPATIYSPVLGMRDEDDFLASSLQYDVFDTRLEVNLDYRWNRHRNSWMMRYRFWPDTPDRSGGRPVAPSIARLEPGQTIELSIAVTAAPPDEWVTAFRPYKDFFRERFGEVRYQRSGEPIMAMSMGIPSLCSDRNPRGYNQWGASGHGRMDVRGWRGFHRRVVNEVMPMGYRRVLFWQISGSYRHHRASNMVWEITSAWPSAMNQTIDDLQRAIDEGLTVGLWWGRAFSISEGFDTGRRHAWDPDNEVDNEAAFRELDRAYELGIRLIGLDDSPRSIVENGRRPPSDVLFNRIMPMLYERYPEMHWIIEPAACDYLHLWAGTFLWSREVRGPNDFMDYLIPGNETHPVFKRDRPPRGQEREFAHMDQEELKEKLQWGYTPIVFNAQRFNLRIDRRLLQNADE